MAPFPVLFSAFKKEQLMGSNGTPVQAPAQLRNADAGLRAFTALGDAVCLAAGSGLEGALREG